MAGRKRSLYHGFMLLTTRPNSDEADHVRQFCEAYEIPLVEVNDRELIKKLRKDAINTRSFCGRKRGSAHDVTVIAKDENIEFVYACIKPSERKLVDAACRAGIELGHDDDEGHNDSSEWDLSDPEGLATELDEDDRTADEIERDERNIKRPGAQGAIDLVSRINRAPGASFNG